ncbi:zinc finger CCCH domain-containing protein 8-like [Silene latifolia]|uniref:zinc finger CCCH domain-containing protein 8-like n=1 Tax=Silene latifolia TaxID=37657 RepID=UPI003D76D331
MGSWGDESCALLEPQNAIDKDVLSNGICHDQNDVKVDVEVGDVNGVGDECRDHESNVVTEEGTLVQQFERLEFRNNESDGAKIEEENREDEKQGEYDDGEVGKKQVCPLPLRLYAVDCSHYLKTGTCKFGQNCRFNHPSLRVYQPVANKEKGFEQSNGSSGDAGKVECKYQTQGRCKYGDACRNNHSAPKVDEERLKLNFLGLPLRPTAQECTFYLRNGSCAYGINCRFHHPDPSPTTVPESGNSLENGSSMRDGFNLPRNYACEPMQSFGGESQGTRELSNGMNARDGPPDAPEMRSYHQTMAPTPGFNQSQVTSSLPANKFPLPHQVFNNISKRVDPSAHYENLMQVDEFPLRPDQPDCDYFMKTGNCKYRSACRYNHPTRQASKLRLPPRISNGHYSRPAPMLPAETSQHHNPYSDSMKKNGMSFANHQNHQMENGEFPERPEQPECEYYMKTGQCKFLSACRYNHPKNRVRTSTQYALNEKGLPLRPGAKLCRNYEQQGVCKYGVDCLYNHPYDYLTRSSGHYHYGSSNGQQCQVSLG